MVGLQRITDGWVRARIAGSHTKHVYASSITFTCRKGGFDCLAGQKSETSYNMLRKWNITSEIQLAVTRLSLRPSDLQCRL